MLGAAASPALLAHSQEQLAYDASGGDSNECGSRRCYGVYKTAAMPSRKQQYLRWSRYGCIGEGGVNAWKPPKKAVVHTDAATTAKWKPPSTKEVCDVGYFAPTGERGWRDAAVD